MIHDHLGEGLVDGWDLEGEFEGITNGAHEIGTDAHCEVGNVHFVGFVVLSDGKHAATGEGDRLSVDLGQSAHHVAQCGDRLFDV